MRGFKDIIGQEHIKEYLQNAISQKKIAHAYIIQGERFSGKEFITKVFAAALQCEKQGTEPCGECRSCRQVQSGNQPDIIYVRHERPNSIGVEDVRSQVSSRISLRINRGAFLYIIGYIGNMNT